MCLNPKFDAGVLTVPFTKTKDRVRTNAEKLVKP